MTVDSSRRSRKPGRRSRFAASIFAPRYRITTLAIVTLTTIIAFEALAVATALPTAARSLHGLASYGWAFTGFLVASVVGMVASGMHADARARGPRCWSAWCCSSADCSSAASPKRCWCWSSPGWSRAWPSAC